MSLAPRFCPYCSHKDEAIDRLLRELREAARPALEFGVAWAEEHMVDDHMVTIDHKDEMLLAELVLRLARLVEGTDGR